MNFVGDVVGSPALTALGGTKIAVAQWPTTINNCGGSSGNRIGIAWGYTLQCDTGSNPWDSTNPFTTGFVHGLYNYIDGSTTWAAGVTHTLPSSFFLSSKPSWWGSLPYPGIGPDITGGTLPTAAAVGEPGGHVYMNPAMNCYYNVLGGTEGGGGGTPFTTYNPEACYAASPVVATPTFSPGAGTYGSTQNVTISTTTIGATICYTTDGSTPTADGAGTCTHGITYSGPVAVSTSLTLQAVGSLSGDSDSAVGSASYIISPVAGVTSFVGGTVVSNGVKIQ